MNLVSVDETERKRRRVIVACRSLDYFRKLLHGPYTKEKFIHLKPGEQFTQEMFF